MKDKIKIELSREKAIVLFEFLSRVEEQINNNLFEDESEKIVLWDIECKLEKELSEPFCSDYLEILKQAREKVTNENH